jgi:hypothetical protein
MSEAQVVELTVDSSGAERGAAAFVDAMAKAQAASEASLKSIAENTAAIRDNLTAANDNASGSATRNGIEFASLANHVRQAAEAAYAFSSSFRGAVNEMALPTLRLVGSSLAAVGTGLVTATNAAGLGIARLGAAAAEASPLLAPLAVRVSAAGAAMAAFSPSIAGVAASILTRLNPALQALSLLKFLWDSWEAGTQALEKYNQISSNTLGLSGEFYQRIIAGAAASATSVDAVTAAFAKLNDAMKPTLGGSDGLNRLDAHLKAGNFADNSGVASLRSANSAEDQFRALVSLVNQANAAQQSLAAVDLTKTILGSDVAENLRKNPEYLAEMLRLADNLAKTKIISDEELERASTLKKRYDEAIASLTISINPLKDLMVELGIKMHETFTQDISDLAKVLEGLTWVYEKAASLIGLAWDKLKNGFSGKFTAVDAAGNPYEAEVQQREMGQSLIPKSKSTIDRGAYDDFRKEIEKVQADRLRSDASANPDAKAISGAREAKDAYDRAEESLLKYIKTTEAAADAVGKSASEQEKLKAVAQLMAAAEKDGTAVTAELAAKMDALGNRAAAAAQKVADAQIKFAIKRGQDTAFLSSEDVSIADQLSRKYPDVATALASVEANALRTNTAFRSMSSVIETNLTTGITDAISGAKTFGQAMSDTGKVVVRALEEMIVKMLIIQPLMRSLQGGLGGMFGGLFGGSAQGPMPDGSVIGSAHGNAFYGGNVIPFARGGVIDGPMMAPMALMGEAGPEAIVPLRRGPDGNLGIMQQGSAGGSVNAPVNISIDARGADEAGTQRVMQQLEQLKAELPARVVVAVTQARKMRQL